MPLNPTQKQIADDLVAHLMTETAAKVDATLKALGDKDVADDVGYRFPLNMFIYAFSVSFALKGQDEAATYAWMAEVSKVLVEQTDDVRSAILHDKDTQEAFARAIVRQAAAFKK